MSEIELQDAILRHALELQRLSSHEEAEALAILRALEDELRQLLASRILSAAAQREINELIKVADEAIASRYADIADLLDTRGLVLLVADRTVEAIQDMFPNATRPTAETLESLSRRNLIEGTPARDWWKTQSNDTARKFSGAVRQGVINGQTNEQVVARIAGPNGFMDVSKRNARTLVHSSIMNAANQARLATYKKNAAHAAGVRWLSTLDSHTCLRCAALDGASWDFEMKPIQGTTLDFQAPPAHFSCRCVLTMIPSRKALDEVFPGLADELLAGRERASKDGPVKGNTGFDAFLARQSPEFVEAMLGKRRADLYRDGKITLRDLVSGTGRPLNLDELRAH